MTKDRSFKRLVRARMAKTGESYTAARAQLLAAAEPASAERPVLATSDAEIRRRTGRGWEEWFDLLDEWHAAEMTHREIARRVAGELGIVPLKWEAQAVTYSFERARGMREVGERADGSYTVTASRTIAAPVHAVFDAVLDPARRAAWLPDGELIDRTATRPRSARFDWGDGPSRVHVTLDPKADARTTISLEHAGLVDAADAERRKPYWRAALLVLKAQLEGQAGGA